MNVTIDIDTSYVGKMFTELKRKLNISLESVVHAEASSVAKTCALWTKEKRTPAQAKKYLQEKIWRQSFGSIGNVVRTARNSNSKLGYNRGAVFYRYTRQNGERGLFYVGQAYSPYTKLPVLGNRMPRAMWRDFKDYWQDGVANFKTETKNRIPNIGFTRKTWIQVLMSLGYSFEATKSIPPKRPIKIKNAQTLVNGTPRTFGYSFKSNYNNNIAVTLINYSTVASRTDKGILQRAIDSRRKAFAIALNKGVFDCEESVATRYGWIVTKL